MFSQMGPTLRTNNKWEGRGRGGGSSASSHKPRHHFVGQGSAWGREGAVEGSAPQGLLPVASLQAAAGQWQQRQCSVVEAGRDVCNHGACKGRSRWGEG